MDFLEPVQDWFYAYQKNRMDFLNHKNMGQEKIVWIF